ncbi:fibronectin type III-like domain-containing protein, partial [Auriculariales sp. MPI-PUGE-AT-0066]
DIAPRFEFGFGLSYTTFAYSNLKLSEVVIPDTPTNSSESLPPGGHPSLWQTSLTATYTVKNTGKLDGHEVSQLYLSYPEGSGEPPKVLRGFARTSLRRGQSSTIKAQLRKRDLAVWDVVLQQWVVPAGEFTMSVGASSRDIHLTAKFTV